MSSLSLEVFRQRLSLSDRASIRVTLTLSGTLDQMTSEILLTGRVHGLGAEGKGLNSSFHPLASTGTANLPTDELSGLVIVFPGSLK